jgi:uncharacterized membrane protein
MNMKYALCSILLIYFFFVSGISYELFSPDVTNHIETPYNLGLSAPRTGIAPVASVDDTKALEWLRINAVGRKTVGDYNSYCLVHGVMQNHVDNLRYGNLTDIKEGDLVYLTSWNVRNNAYVEPNGVGVREIFELPDFSKGYRLVYSSAWEKDRNFPAWAKVLEKDSSYVKPESPYKIGSQLYEFLLNCD